MEYMGGGAVIPGANSTSGGNGGKGAGQKGYGGKWTCPKCDYWHNGSMVSTCGWCGRSWQDRVAAGAEVALKGKGKSKGKGFPPKKKEGKGYG